MKKLPKKIYVQKIEDDSDEYLNADENGGSLKDGQVGIYELKETKNKVTSVTFE